MSFVLSLSLSIFIVLIVTGLFVKDGPDSIDKMMEDYNSKHKPIH